MRGTTLATRPCIQCGTPTRTTRCPTCQARKEQTRNQARTHYGPAWDKLSRELRADHVAAHGWWCPGWHTPPHPSHDLTVDHITPRTGTAGYRVLCRPCNARKGNQPDMQPTA